MTRKDYVLIAGIIGNEVLDAEVNFEPLHKKGLVVAARALADAFENDNPRFDRGRFLAACGDNLQKH